MTYWYAWCTLAAFLFASVAVNCAAAEIVNFYVSANKGSDSNDGKSPASAFQTIQRAQSAVRYTIPTATSNITVNIAAGRYYAPTPIRFNSSDSFPRSNNEDASPLMVTYQGPAFSDPLDRANQAMIIGGIQIPPSRWHPVNPENATVWKANITDLLSALPSRDDVVDNDNDVAEDSDTCTAPQNDTTFYGADLPNGEVLSGGFGQCCAACANRSDCKAFSFCGPNHPICGSPSHPVDCYLKSSMGSVRRMPNWTSATLNTPPGPRRFFNLLENDAASILARTPDKGSGYLKELGCSNSNTEVTCPISVFVDGGGALANNTADLTVFANLGADWFSENRIVSAVNIDTSSSSVKVSFSGGSGQISANDKVYIQGGWSLISEPGEWALDSQAGTVYLWPQDAARMTSSSANIAAITSERILDVRGESFVNPIGLVHNLRFQSLALVGSDFTAEYNIAKPSDPANTSPVAVREGMVRVENATNITISECLLQDAGHAGVWVEGYAQSVTVDRSWIERPGFCGFYGNGPYPGDTHNGAVTTLEESYMNRDHRITNSVIHDFGQRVGHGAATWFYQSGDNKVLNNILKEGPRNAVGFFGIRHGAVSTNTFYGQPANFWTTLDALTTRNVEVAYNEVSNCVRDTADAGAFELWGVGVNNTAHHNCISDMDPGNLDGSWMNFLFQDDASHYTNFSSNIVFGVSDTMHV